MVSTAHVIATASLPHSPLDRRRTSLTVCRTVLALAAVAIATRSAEVYADEFIPFVERDLVVELGYAVGTKLLIVNCDDAGLCQAVNNATQQLLTQGSATSATVLVPAPEAADFIAGARRDNHDVGIHLCLNGEWGRRLPLRPLLPAERVPSLVGPDGLFPESIAHRELRARAVEAEAEFRAQVQQARKLGLDPTHLDGHMGCYNYRPDLLEAALKVAEDECLPLRVVYLAAAARARGIPAPDRFAMFYGEPLPTRKQRYLDFLRSLGPGVTELAIHVADDTPQWRSLDRHEAALRIADRTIHGDPEIARVIEQQNIVPIGWRPLHDLMRRWRQQRPRD